MGVIRSLIGHKGFLPQLSDAGNFYKARWPLALLALLAISGCNALPENRLIERGIGTDLYSSDTAKSTQLLDLYLRHMCVQAGVGRLDKANQPQCGMGEIKSGGWTLVVKAGFNDIDRRCDAYLAWLNSKRRTNASILNQLSQASTVTQSIMRITSVSANPITLVGIGFGLVRDTFTNYYSRLLLEVESSTVELVVTENRQRFRDAFADTPVLYRPDAVHILRSYLLICTPHVIENNINIRTRFSVSGNVAPPLNDYGEQVRKSLTKSSLLQAIPDDPRSELDEQDRGSETQYITGWKNDDEKTITEPNGRRMQQNLCIRNTSRNFGDQTRAAILLVKQAQPGAFRNRTSNTLDNQKEIDLILDASSCIGSSRKYLNAYEKYKMFDSSEIKAFQKVLNACQNELRKSEAYNSLVTQSGVFDVATRNAILDVKSRLSEAGKLEEVQNNQVFKGSYDAVVLCGA